MFFKNNPLESRDISGVYGTLNDRKKNMKLLGYLHLDILVSPTLIWENSSKHVFKNSPPGSKIMPSGVYDTPNDTIYLGILSYLIAFVIAIFWLANK